MLMTRTQGWNNLYHNPEQPSAFHLFPTKAREEGGK